MKRVILSFLVLGVLVALGSSVAMAQQEEPGWRLVPRIGSYWLDRTDGVLFPDGRTEGLALGTVVGVSLDFDTPVSWLGFRFSADRTVGAERIIGPGAESPGAVLRGLSVETRIQPVPRTWAFRPFAVLGSGAVFWDVEDPAGPGTSQGSAAFLYGFGVDVDLAGVPLRLEGLHRRYESDRHVVSPVESRPPRLAIHNAHAVFTVGVRVAAR